MLWPWWRVGLETKWREKKARKRQYEAAAESEGEDGWELRSGCAPVAEGL